MPHELVVVLDVGDGHLRPLRLALGLPVGHELVGRDAEPVPGAGNVAGRRGLAVEGRGRKIGEAGKQQN